MAKIFFQLLVLVASVLLIGTSKAGVSEAWTSWYDDMEDDIPVAIAVDKDGNVYVSGTAATMGISHYATVKYSPDGDELWVARFYGGAGSAKAVDMAVDSSGNTYVTGYAQISVYEARTDVVTVKYDTNGSELWAQRSGASRMNAASALTVDALENVYVTGLYHANDGSGIEAIATLKYDASGGEQWIQYYDYPDRVDRGVDIEVDAEGNVYVAGISRVNNDDYVTIKYDKEGTELWVSRYDDNAAEDKVTKLALDNENNVYVTGASYTYSASPDKGAYVTIKYDASGKELWVARYETYQAGGSERPVGLAVNASGDVYVAGMIGVFYTETEPDYATIKYDKNGNELWAARYDNGYTDSPSALDIDAEGGVYVTGRSNTESNADYATVKYDSDGNRIWVVRYDRGESDLAKAISVDSLGNIYVTGYSLDFSTGGMRDYVTVKYIQTDASDDDKGGGGGGSINGVDIIALLATWLWRRRHLSNA